MEVERAEVLSVVLYAETLTGFHERGRLLALRFWNKYDRLSEMSMRIVQRQTTLRLVVVRQKWTPTLMKTFIRSRSGESQRPRYVEFPSSEVRHSRPEDRKCGE